MVCCIIPCLKWLDHKSPGNGALMLVVTEFIRWSAIALPIYFSCWRYAELRGYTEFIADWDLHMQYWVVTSGIFLGATLVIYIPIKIIGYRMWDKYHHQLKWRPSILLYLIVCAFPCLVINLVAAKTDGQDRDFETLDPATTVAVQVTVLGLTVTEWMSKIRDEEFTYDLVTAMSTDFFFLYDVIDMFMLAYRDADVFQSDWVYASFGFGFLALFKYLPRQPTAMTEFGTPQGAVVCTCTSMICVDIPFVIVRLASMIHFGMEVGDLIHPAKNFGLICFGCTELYIIYINNKNHTNKYDQIKEHRCCRIDGTCDDDPLNQAFDNTYENNPVPEMRQPR